VLCPNFETTGMSAHKTMQLSVKHIALIFEGFASIDEEYHVMT
jgi:hypothetical protein